MEAFEYPRWLMVSASASLIVAAACAGIIVFDLCRGNKQHMWVMNLVWPITALYGSIFTLWAYFSAGHLSTQKAVEEAKRQGKSPPGKEKPFWQISALGATHCGSGCTLGDIAAEWLIVAFPFAILGRKIFGAWVLDYILAFLFGVAFQYFTIVPMKKLPKGKGVWAAVKADALSLTAWQVGMYGWMAVAVFAIFGHEIPKNNPVFWFMMQVAMWFGLLASFPVNWWLIKKGMKEKM